jgi:FimV-like protein
MIMRNLILTAALLSSPVYSQDMDYWEQVFKTSIDSQIKATLANFQTFPVDVTPSSSFGMRRHPISNENKLHKGVDLPAEEGTPFRAVAPGVVIFSGEWGGLGNLIVIDHGDGLVTRYGHAQTLLLEVGDVVRRDDEIGTVGSTGMVTGAHVHYEILQDNDYIDPEVFITQRKQMPMDELRQQKLEEQPIDINNYIDSMIQSKSVNFTGALASVEYGDDVAKNVAAANQAHEIAHHTAVLEPQVLAVIVHPVVMPDPVKDENEIVAVTPRPYADTITTKRTLWSLADQIRPQSASVFQGMIAIYNANPKAFPDKNVNKRWVDINMNLPSAEQILAVDHNAAREKYYSDLAMLESEKTNQLEVALSTSDPKNDNAPL